MKKKIFITIVAALGIITLTACAATTPTSIATTTPKNNSTDQTAPPASVSTATNTAPPTASSTIDTSTLACGNGSQSATVTPELTEGPYFTANSPERASLLEDGMAGTKLVITGYVYTTDCQPVVNALLDFWQADANGV